MAKDSVEVNVGDFDTCKNAGAKLSKAADGTWVCTLKDKTYRDKGKSESVNTSPAKAVAAETFKKVEIISDGTRAGTRFLINGKEVPGLASVSFYFFNDNFGPNVGLSYRTEEKAAAGEIGESHYFTLNPPPEPKAEASIQPAAAIASLLPRGNQRRVMFAQI